MFFIENFPKFTRSLLLLLIEWMARCPLRSWLVASLVLAIGTLKRTIISEANREAATRGRYKPRTE